MMDDLQQPVAKLVGIAFAQTINENQQAKHKRTAHHRPMAIGPQDCDGALSQLPAPRAERFLPPNGRRSSSISSIETASGLFFHPPVRQSALLWPPSLLLRDCNCPRSIELKI
jgi:hypothetical protein